MREELDFILNNIEQDPVSIELKTMFDKTLLSSAFSNVRVKKNVRTAYAFFGKMVLHRAGPVKEHFQYRFERAAMDLRIALENNHDVEVVYSLERGVSDRAA